jgi:hypothetical protein
MANYKLPVDYTKLNGRQKREVRQQYEAEQQGQCYWCKKPLSGGPTLEVEMKAIDHRLFPPGFLRNPIHLQHNHDTGMTEGAVHAKCNAVMWQYYGR